MGVLATLHRSYWAGPIALKDPALAQLFDSGRRSLAGPLVSETTALTVAAFWDGVQQLSTDVAKLPLHLRKRRSSGKGSDTMPQSPVYRLMRSSPNPEMRSVNFRRLLTQHALVYGNGYAEIVRDGANRARELWPLHPTRVAPFYTNPERGRGELRYRIDGELVLGPESMLHISGPGDDGVAGFNLVSVAREAIGLSLASQQFAGAFFGHGTRFGGVLSADQDLTQEQADEIRTQIEALHAKADQAFRLLVLGAGFRYESAGTPPNEAQMKEIRDQQVAEVARYLNMPLHKLKLNTPGAVSYNSVEMADLDYYKGPILNWITLWEQELNAKLIFPLEQASQFFKHNVDAFLRGDIATRYEALGKARDRGIISANEWRDLEDMNPQTGDQGELYLVQKNMIPLSRIDELADKETAPDPPPKPPTSPEPNEAQPPEDADAIERAVTRAEEAEALVEEIRSDLDAAREELEQMAAADTEARDAARQEIAGLVGQLATLEAIKAQADTDLEAQRSEHAAAIERLQTDLADRDAVAQRAQEAAQEAQEQADRKVANLGASLEAVGAENDARTLQIADLTDQLAAEQQRARSVIGSHRALVADVMTQIVRRQASFARTKQGTREKFRRWSVNFRGHEEPICEATLRPIVAVHLAWTRSSEDIDAATAALVAEHLDTYQARIGRILEANGDEFREVLERELTQHETREPDRVADRLLAEEINRAH